ncbi:Uncharacterised protein [Mycobacteroides abscessus subsp. abscessus]|nr:Uncharacterised protein [Mycobacteroides abscessus subsp. abscessus]
MGVIRTPLSRICAYIRARARKNTIGATIASAMICADRDWAKPISSYSGSPGCPRRMIPAICRPKTRFTSITYQANSHPTTVITTPTTTHGISAACRILPSSGPASRDWKPNSFGAGNGLAGFWRASSGTQPPERSSGRGWGGKAAAAGVVPGAP